MSGILGLIILALDIYAIIRIIGSGAATSAKIGWSLLVLILPVIGLLVWVFAGPGSRSATPT